MQNTFFFALSTQQVAYAVGGLGLLLALPLLLAPAPSRAGLLAFPRHAPAAWLLTAATLLWVAWIISHAALGRFEFLKPGLYLATPAAFFLLINFLDELLAARALGGLLLLAANPVLNFVRWHDSSWRLVLVSLAYAWVVLGIVLVLSPYMFRRWMLPLVDTDGRLRLTGLLLAAGSAGVLYLGFAVY